MLLILLMFENFSVFIEGSRGKFQYEIPQYFDARVTKVRVHDERVGTVQFFWGYNTNYNK